MPKIQCCVDFVVSVLVVLILQRYYVNDFFSSRGENVKKESYMLDHDYLLLLQQLVGVPISRIL